MKQTIATLFFLGITLTGFCQDKSFDLSKYKFPDYKRHELEFNFNSSGNNSNNYLLVTPANNSSGYKNDNSSSSFNSIINIGYQFNHYTRKRIDWVSSGLNGQYQYDKSESVNSYNKRTEPQLWGFIHASRRNYITDNKLFWEGSAYLSINTYRIKEMYSRQETVISTNNSLTLKAYLGIGTGRIEHVNDLWQGYYILEKLREQNSIRNDVNEEDIFKFSSFISKLKNKRFFDSRLRRIAELQSLDSLLHKQNLIANDDISYFTTLNDYWSFPISFDRKTGKEFQVNISPQFDRNYHNSIMDSSYAPTLTNLVSTILFDCSKQINFYWERNFHFDITNTTLIAKNNDVEENSPNNLIGTSASFGYGFFPNTRTRIQLKSQYYGYEYPYYEGESMSKSWMNNFSLNFEANYFISPQLQITGNFSGNYWFSEHNSSHGHNTNFNLGFRYAIF